MQVGHLHVSIKAQLQNVCKWDVRGLSPIAAGYLVARGFIPVGSRSGPKVFTTATQPNGDKSPRHRRQRLHGLQSPKDAMNLGNHLRRCFFDRSFIAT